MILIHDTNVKESRELADKMLGDFEEIIVWNSTTPETATLKEKYYRKWDPAQAQLPSRFPSVTHSTLPVVCPVVSENPADDLTEAVNSFYKSVFSEYGLKQYDTSWSELVKDGVISIDNARDQVVTAIKAEAQKRILGIWDSHTLELAQVRQTNTMRDDMSSNTTDPRFTQTDAIRAASNEFETALADMEKEELAELVVSEWDGWPDAENADNSVETEDIEK